MDQNDLFFNESVNKKIDLQGLGELDFYPSWLPLSESNRYFELLLQEMPWQQPTIKIYGEERKIPRLQAWFGESGAYMTYSETRFEPLDWHPLLCDLKQRIEGAFSCCFNSVLVNLYRDGEDSVSWHADDEPELGRNPVIASLSLGCGREFRLKLKPGKQKSSKQQGRTFRDIRLPLKAGDLVVMRGETQHYWHHAILKEKGVKDSRINLTFRLVKN